MYLYLLSVQIDGRWWLVMASFSSSLHEDADRLFGEGMEKPLAWHGKGWRRVAELGYWSAGRYFERVKIDRLVTGEVYALWLKQRQRGTA